MTGRGMVSGNEPLIPDRLREELRKLLRGRIVYMGIGNILRGDDAIGPELTCRLSRMGMRTVDAGSVPENYIGSVARLKPDTVVLIDAVHLDRRPGSVELLDRSDLAGGIGFTTHTLSPVLVMERLEEETGAAVFLLAIQPKCLDFGAPLSGEMETVLAQLPEALLGIAL
ncbi:MAG: hydrogenase maturation protease [Candidatus Fermentibacteraceae bacterium]|nr:hydrogenase maturation protease [Candidatus Fermentibacteraceae bacterium]MBN2608516.1 hydrogenase maturation protease [Candidatus Fermentibacteraceae bacterium]